MQTVNSISLKIKLVRRTETWVPFGGQKIGPAMCCVCVILEGGRPRFFHSFEFIYPFKLKLQRGFNKSIEKFFSPR